MHSTHNYKLVCDEARRSFGRLYSRGQWNLRWSKMRGKCGLLQDLYHVRKQRKIVNRNYAGVQVVPIDQIRGSEGRCRDFDANFFPLRQHNAQRWMSIEIARRTDVELPLVELLQVDDVYYVRDGHHRISVAKAAGQMEIRAEVIIWECGKVAAATDSERVRQQPAVARTEMVRSIAQTLIKGGQMVIGLFTSKISVTASSSVRLAPRALDAATTSAGN